MRGLRSFGEPPSIAGHPAAIEPFRPYIDLTAGSSTALHAVELLDTARADTLLPIPWQIVHPAQFRRLLEATSGHPVAVESTAELAPERRSAIWDRLNRSAVDHRTETAAQLERAAVLLVRLGFFNQAGALMRAERRRTDERWAAFLLFLEKLCDVRGSASRGQPVIVPLAERLDLWPPVRVLAYATAMVRSSTDPTARPEELPDLHRRSADVVAAVEADPDRATSAFFLSTYWRGASFVPFKSSDITETLRWLDIAEHYANEAAESGRTSTALMARYPILETRSRVLRCARRSDEALEVLADLHRLDPFDQRCLMKIGDTHEELGRKNDAREAYELARRLSYPYQLQAEFALAALSERPLTSITNTDHHDEEHAT